MKENRVFLLTAVLLGMLCVTFVRGFVWDVLHRKCNSHGDCLSDEACSNKKCIDPCPGSCGLNSRCNAVNHLEVCDCLPGYTGDAYMDCFKIES